MSELFLNIVNRSISASWVVVAVLLEKGPEMGECPALGAGGGADALSVLHRERIEPDPKRRADQPAHHDGSVPFRPDGRSRP